MSRREASMFPVRRRGRGGLAAHVLLLLGLFASRLFGCADPSPPPAAPTPPTDTRAVYTPSSVDPVAGFLASPQLYHETSWDAVRARVLTHLAAAGRDLARARALRQDWSGCAERYDALADELGGTTAVSSFTLRIRDALAAAARRDGALCGALARGEPPPLQAAGVARLRSRYHRIVAGLPEEAELRAELAAFTPPTWSDDPNRSGLRATLVEIWADSLDPIGVTDPWGPWTALEATRQVEALRSALDRRAEPDPHLLPSRLLPKVEGTFTGEELSGAPNGDSYVDTGGVAGPAGMGQGDSRVAAEAAALASLDDRGAAAAIVQIAARVGQGADGGRAARQVRNTGVRVLARRGAWGEALSVLASSWPLVPFDQACPNRVATLHGLEGRLRLLAGDPDAEGTLRTAIEDSRSFLQKISEVESRLAPSPGLVPTAPAPLPRPGSPAPIRPKPG